MEKWRLHLLPLLFLLPRHATTLVQVQRSGRRDAVQPENVALISSRVERTSELKACRRRVQTNREILAGCDFRRVRGPFLTNCTCYCPVCVPDNYPKDLSKLPVCTTPPPSVKAIPVPDMPPLEPLPILKRGVALVDVDISHEVSIRDGRSTLQGCLQEQQELLGKIVSLGCSKHMFRGQQRRLDPVPAECYCRCPPCSSYFGPPPSCRPPGWKAASLDINPTHQAGGVGNAAHQEVEPLTVQSTTTFHVPPVVGLPE